MGLTGFGFIGIVITWPKKRIGDQNIKEHWDKIVVNIVRWTHVTHPSIIKPFALFFSSTKQNLYLTYVYLCVYIYIGCMHWVLAQYVCVYGYMFASVCRHMHVRYKFCPLPMNTYVCYIYQSHTLITRAIAHALRFFFFVLMSKPFLHSNDT